MQTPENLANLCAIALNAEINLDYAKSLIQANQLMAPRDLICDTWPWPVRIRALGPLKVEINGEPLVFQGKAQAKPMAMLKALIFNAGLPVSTEQVAVTLWPDADEQQAKVNTKSTLHRLRKLPGHNAVELREGYYTSTRTIAGWILLPLGGCWIKHTVKPIPWQRLKTVFVCTVVRYYKITNYPSRPSICAWN